MDRLEGMIKGYQMKQKMIAAITAKNEELISDILQQAQDDDELLKELVELINLEPGKRKTIDDDLKQREKDTEEEFRRLKGEAWRPRIESMKPYIRSDKTFNDWARKDTWAQDTGGEFVEGIPKRLLDNSEINEVWMIAVKEVEKETPEPETAQMKPQMKPKKKRTKKKRTKKKRTKKKRTKKKRTKKKKR
jgi:hypothetical protein